MLMAGVYAHAPHTFGHFSALDNGNNGSTMPLDHMVMMTTPSDMFLEDPQQEHGQLMGMGMDVEQPSTLLITADDGLSVEDTSEMVTNESNSSARCSWSMNIQEQIDTWCNLPPAFQEQLHTHYLLYLNEIQQILQIQSDQLTVLVPEPMSPTSPTSPTKLDKRRKSVPSFKVEHYKFQGQKKAKKHGDQSPTEAEYSPTFQLDLSSSSPNMSSYSLCPPDISPRASPNSNGNHSPTHSSVIQELATLLPPVSQIEEALRSGASSQSATSTVMELSKRPELLTLKQSDAAKIMGISTSVLSKRWREATHGKKWPHRIHHKLKRAETY